MMSDARLILVPQFIDRSGRTVYHIHEDNPESRTLSVGKFIGVIRMDRDDNLQPEVEWVPQP
jgi:hypothetical protein